MSLQHAQRSHKHLILLALTLTCVYSTPAFAENELYPNGRAATVSPGRIEFALWSPSRFPISPDAELYTQLMLNMLYPNIGLKVAWKAPSTEWYIATTHQLSYPTWFYATSPLYTQEGPTPQLLTLSNAVLLEHRLNAFNSITMSLGADLSPQLTDGALKPVTLPWLYPRFASHRSGYSLSVAARWRGHVWDHLTYWTKLELFALPTSPGNFAMEYHLVFDWQHNRTISLQAGTFITYTPGDDLNTPLITPYIDIIWAITSLK